MLERFEPRENDVTLWGTVYASTAQVRRLGAVAAREHLPFQLDWRVDAVLDPAKTHIVGIKAGAKEEIYSQYPSGPVVVCQVYLCVLGSIHPFLQFLSVHVMDMAGLEPAGLNSGGERTSMQVKSGGIRDRHAQMARTALGRATGGVS